MNATTEINWADYKAKWKGNPTKHRCDCGQPATKYKANGFVCERCDAIEQRMYTRPNSQAAYCDRSHLGRKAEYVRAVECFTVHLPRGMAL